MYKYAYMGEFRFLAAPGCIWNSACAGGVFYKYAAILFIYAGIYALFLKKEPAITCFHILLDQHVLDFGFTGSLNFQFQIY